MSLFRASRYVASVPMIDLEELAAEGVRCILIDRDNTCVPRDAGRVPRDVADWLARAREMGMRVRLVSNNFYGSQVAATAEEFGVGKVDHAMKPAPFALWAALRREGVPPEQAVMIGDQVFTDIAAGNLAGVRTILVRPQSRTDLFYTRAFRVFESIPLRGVTFEGEGSADTTAAVAPATVPGIAPATDPVEKNVTSSGVGERER